LENAFAVAAYDPSLSDSVRIGAFLQLGNRYGSAKDIRKAAISFQAAALLATLSPSVADYARLDTYLQASAGLRGIGASDAARFVTDQAYLVAQYAPSLQPEQRARRLEQIANTYTQLNAGALANQARARSVDASTASATTPISGTRAVFAPGAAKLPPSPEIENAVAVRTAAATALSEDLVDNPPKTVKDWSSDLIANLNDALVTEDDVRLAYYDKQLGLTKDPNVKIALWRDKITWLALKYRIARGAFGASLVADWEKDPAAIAGDLGTASDELFRLTQAQAASLPKGNIVPAQEDLLRQALISSRWGWYSGTPEQDLIDQLDPIGQALIDAAYPELRLNAIKRNSKTVFLLLPDDLSGQGEKALPK
jgi:hypothetical protein